MFVVSKDRNSIINTSQVTAIFVGADNCTIKADFQNVKGCQLGRYNSEAAAVTAIGIIAQSIENKEVCYMPKDNEIEAKINLFEQKKHHITGKKTKGHGGS